MNANRWQNIFSREIFEKGTATLEQELTNWRAYVIVFSKEEIHRSKNTFVWDGTRIVSLYFDLPYTEGVLPPEFSTIFEFKKRHWKNTITWNNYVCIPTNDLSLFQIIQNILLLRKDTDVAEYITWYTYAGQRIRLAILFNLPVFNSRFNICDVIMCYIEKWNTSEDTGFYVSSVPNECSIANDERTYYIEI
jgi:hypothetical protein